MRRELGWRVDTYIPHSLFVVLSSGLMLIILSIVDFKIVQFNTCSLMIHATYCIYT